MMISHFTLDHSLQYTTGVSPAQLMMGGNLKSQIETTVTAHDAHTVSHKFGRGLTPGHSYVVAR